MATISQTVCDVNADHGDAKTTYFGSGSEYFKADLPEDVAKLEKAQEPFVRVGTPVSVRDLGKATNGAGDQDPAMSGPGLSARQARSVTGARIPPSSSPSGVPIPATRIASFTAGYHQRSGGSPLGRLAYRHSLPHSQLKYLARLRPVSLAVSAQR